MWRIETRFEMLADAPVLMYHGSHPAFRAGIQEHGLKTHMPQPSEYDVDGVPQEPNDVIFVGDFETATTFSSGDIWEVNISGLKRSDNNIDPDEGILILENIPPNRLRLVMADWEMLDSSLGDEYDGYLS